MLELRRVSDGVITVVVFEDVMRLICGYASQCGGYLEEYQFL